MSSEARCIPWARKLFAALAEDIGSTGVSARHSHLATTELTALYPPEIQAQVRDSLVASGATLETGRVSLLVRRVLLAHSPEGWCIYRCSSDGAPQCSRI